MFVGGLLRREPARLPRGPGLWADKGVRPAGVRSVGTSWQAWMPRSAASATLFMPLPSPRWASRTAHPAA